MESDMTLEQFIGTIDFALLKKQKEELLRVSFLKGVNENELEGILNLIDYIQDTAVDVLGYPEDEVFNFKVD